MSDSPAVLLVGPGAMGCLHAALLAEAGLPVTLLDHRPERAALISAQGVRLVLPDGPERTVAVPCTADAAPLFPADLVLIFTKAYDTAAAAETARPAVGPDTTVLTLQNGLGNYEVLQQAFTPAQVLAGTTPSGATLLAPGRVRLAGRGEITLGSPAGDRTRAEAAAKLLRRGRLAVTVTDDPDAALWRKAIVNAAINPLGALTRRRNGELLEQEGLRALLGEVAHEAHRVAVAHASALADLDPVAAVEQVCRVTAVNQCSMLQDVLAGRRTEIQQINGEIVRRGQAVGLSTPLGVTLTALVEALGQSG